jgi:hypothetical protein
MEQKRLGFGKFGSNKEADFRETWARPSINTEPEILV